MNSESAFVEIADRVVSTPDCSDSRSAKNTGPDSGSTVIYEHKKSPQDYDSEEWQSLAESIIEQMDILYGNNTAGEYVRRTLECLDWWTLSMSDLNMDSKELYHMSRHMHLVATFVTQMNDLYEWSERLANRKISQS